MEIKKLLIRIKWFPMSILNKLKFRIRGFDFGKAFTSYGSIFIRGTGKITIGNSVTITSCRETDPIGGDIKTILYACGGYIKIGNCVGISNTAIVSMDSITIEDNVMIGGSCKIYDNDFHPVCYDERMKSTGGNVNHAPVVIKEGAFIGGHSIILKGVVIGSRAVVAAGSVVTKSVPTGEIWGGNPAKFLKKVGGDFADKNER